MAVLLDVAEAIIKVASVANSSERTSRELSEKEGRGPMVRSPSILISEIGHDLDEVITGWAQKDDALIKVGINDARRDLEELYRAITEAQKS